MALWLAVWRWASMLAATATMLVAAVYLFDPPQIPSARDKSLFFFAAVVYQPVAEKMFSPFVGELLLGATALAALGACALALVLAIRKAPTVPQVRLAVAFSFAALAAVLFYFVEPLPQFRERLGIDQALVPLVMLRFLAGGCLALATWQGLRFFLDYPKTILEEDWRRRSDAMQEKAGNVVASGWRGKFYPAWMMPSAVGSERAESGARLDLRNFRFLRSFWPPVVGLGLAAMGALAYAAGKSGFALGYLGGSLLPIFFPFWMVAMAAALLEFQRDQGTPDARRRIDWIASSVVVGGAILVSLAVLSSLLFLILAIASPEALTRLGGLAILSLPMAALPPAFALIVVASFALSIFYRGAVDPAIAARKISIWSILAIVVAFLFVLIERTIAAKVTAWLGLSPDSGAIVAGAAIAGTISPIRSQTERIVQKAAARYLPLDSVVNGERRTMAVAFCDLSGYTALSARDEVSAHLLAALLQRQAQVLCGKHEIRLVKSMGDAVILESNQASTMAAGLVELHEMFPKAARAIGLEPLAVHSGAHWGDVIEAPDGDLYGQTVNLAARIQGEATAGQIACSQAFVTAAGMDAAKLDFLGERRMKNVPDPMACYDLCLPPVLGEVAPSNATT